MSSMTILVTRFVIYQRLNVFAHEMKNLLSKICHKSSIFYFKTKHEKNLISSISQSLDFNFGFEFGEEIVFRRRDEKTKTYDPFELPLMVSRLSWEELVSSMKESNYNPLKV